MPMRLVERWLPPPTVKQESEDVHRYHDHSDVNPSESVVSSSISAEALPPLAITYIAEQLAAIGSLRSLAALNATSKSLHARTLPILWRTVIWDPSRKDLELEEYGRDRYWQAVMVDSAGAPHIQFIVDRESTISMTKKIPSLMRTALAYRMKTLKAYTAVFIDHEEETQRLLNSEDLKIVTHLLPAYRPGSDDFLTVRHSLYMLDRCGAHNAETGPHDAYFLFILHSSANEQYYIPASLEERHLPAMPYTLDSVLLIPEQDDFVPADRHRIVATAVDFFAAIDHQASKSWKGYRGQFTSVPQKSEKLCNGYLNFPWHKSPSSALTCAESVAQALQIARTTTRHWIEINIEIDTQFPADRDETIKRAIGFIQPFYLERALRRLHPASHGMGDVTVCDGTTDLHAVLRRIRPGEYGQQQEAVELFIQRFPKGTGADKSDKEVGNGMGPHVTFREVYSL